MMQQLLKCQVSKALYKPEYKDYSPDTAKLGFSLFSKSHMYLIKILLQNIARMHIYKLSLSLYKQINLSITTYKLCFL